MFSVRDLFAKSVFSPKNGPVPSRPVNGYRLRLDGLGLTDASLKYLKPLVGLEELDLHLNPEVTDAGLAELKGLTSLRELHLGGNNKITDAGMAQLKSLQNLRFLQVAKLGPTGLAALTDLRHLEHLEVGEYEPGRPTGDLSVLRSLKWLNIGVVAGDNPGKVALPADLRHLVVSHSRAAQLDLQSAEHVENVEVDLHRSLFSGNKKRELQWLGSVPKLRELTLYYPNAHDLKAIAGLTSLHALSTVATCSVPIGNEGMRALASLRNLESLKIEDYYGLGNKEYEVNAGMDVLPKLENLRHLELNGFPAVTSKALANIWEAKKLRALKLQLTGQALDASLEDTLKHVDSLSKLEELSLSFTSRIKLTDDGLKSLAKLKRLRCLDLGSSDGYTDDGLASLMRALPDLRVLKRTYTPVAN